MGKIILLCGIPASGKSSYCAWLEKSKGFITWDFEHETLDNVGSRLKSNIGTGHDIGGLFRASITTDKTIVIDWGFPPDTHLEYVKILAQQGVDIWWFDGDRDQARISFLKRGTVSEEALDIQMKKIEMFWQEIEEVFTGKIVLTIKNGTGYIDPEQIYKIMFG